MIKGAKVLRNAQIVDRLVPQDFLSDLRRDQTREILDAVIGCIEPERDYVFNLHQDEQTDPSRVMFTNTVSFEPVVRCRDCVYMCAEYSTVDKHGEVISTGYLCERTELLTKPDGFCSWAERRDA